MATSSADVVHRSPPGLTESIWAPRAQKPLSPDAWSSRSIAEALPPSRIRSSPKDLSQDFAVAPGPTGVTHGQQTSYGAYASTHLLQPKAVGAGVKDRARPSADANVADTVIISNLSSSLSKVDEMNAYTYAYTLLFLIDSTRGAAFQGSQPRSLSRAIQEQTVSSSSRSWKCLASVSGRIASFVGFTVNSYRPFTRQTPVRSQGRPCLRTRIVHVSTALVHAAGRLVRRWYLTEQSDDQSHVRPHLIFGSILFAHLPLCSQFPSNQPIVSNNTKLIIQFRRLIHRLCIAYSPFPFLPILPHYALSRGSRALH